MKKWLMSIGVIIMLIVLASGGYWGYHFFQKEPVPKPVDFVQVSRSHFTESASANGSDVKEINLDMPFYTQAPYANWNYPWQEACEEASILLVANVYWDKGWNRAQFNQRILDMVEWQKKRFGDYWHTTMEQTAEILEYLLKLKTVTHENPTLEDIKRILAKGHFIVMPLDGKLLKNPYFSNGGPVYHVVVVKGYTQNNGIITHDVGTRRGEDYVYSWKVIDSALHDYAIPMKKGARRLLEVLPPT